MVKRIQIVIGGDGAFKELKEIAKSNKSNWWSCGKDTKAGDFLLIYAMKPESAIVATGLASSDARPDKTWHYVADIKNVKILEKPITREEMLAGIPNWGWPRQPRRPTYPEAVIVRKLLKLASLKETPNAEPPVTISASGAGFGTAKQNREVERAACEAVQAHFERMGYTLVSREKEKIGYDFDARRKGKDLHLEVKGISGSDLRFPITANEVDCAKSDTKFCLAVVTQALSAVKKVHLVSRKDFLKHFEITPLAYFAEAKSSLFA